MRLPACLMLTATVAMAGCVTTRHEWADDRPTIGAQQPKPFCSSGPNGKTAACAATIAINSAIHNAQK